MQQMMLYRKKNLNKEEKIYKMRMILLCASLCVRVDVASIELKKNYNLVSFQLVISRKMSYVEDSGFKVNMFK